MVVLPTALFLGLAANAQKKPVKKAASSPKPAKEAAMTAPPRKVEFLRDVAPILDRNGCSTAGCHGKFGGRGGFERAVHELQVALYEGVA